MKLILSQSYIEEVLWEVFFFFNSNWVRNVQARNQTDLCLDIPTEQPWMTLLSELCWPELSRMAQLVECWHIKLFVPGSTLTWIFFTQLEFLKKVYILSHSCNKIIFCSAELSVSNNFLMYRNSVIFEIY